MIESAKLRSMNPPERLASEPERAHRSGPFTNLTAELIQQSLPRWLERVVPDWGERLALVAPGKAALTYADLFRGIRDFFDALDRFGIGRGDRVAVVAADNFELALTFLGVSSCAACAPINPNLRAHELEWIFSSLQPKALIVAPGTGSDAPSVAQRHGITVIDLGSIENAGSVRHSVDPDMNSASVNGRGFAEAADDALMLFTSGTTARPKLVALTHANLLASAHSIGATLQLSGADRGLNIMPLFHIHGLVGGLLAPLLSGGSVVSPAGFDATQFFSWLEEFQPTWYTAVPTMHQAILAQAPAYLELIRRAPLRFLRSSSAALPPRLLEELEGTFKIPAIESYGMTEAAHQMASNPLPPAQRKAGSVGKAAGPEIAIMDERGKHQPAGTVGEVAIRGAGVMAGYIDNDGANAEAFTQGWFRTGDQGYLDGDGYLFLTGRIKELINRGGEKISPREIDDVLLAHPAVAQAATFAVPHTTLGEEVAAAVVLRSGTQATGTELRDWAGGQLADFKVPKQLLIVDEIPKGPTGKLRRADLAQSFAARLTAVASSSASQLESIVTQIYAEVLGVKEVAANDNFFALGGDSLRATQIIARIRARLEVNLSIAVVFQKSTVTELAEAIAQLMGGADHV